MFHFHLLPLRFLLWVSPPLTETCSVLFFVMGVLPNLHRIIIPYDSPRYNIIFEGSRMEHPPVTPDRGDTHTRSSLRPLSASHIPRLQKPLWREYCPASPVQSETEYRCALPQPFPVTAAVLFSHIPGSGTPDPRNKKSLRYHPRCRSSSARYTHPRHRGYRCRLRRNPSSPDTTYNGLHRGSALYEMNSCVPLPHWPTGKSNPYPPSSLSAIYIRPSCSSIYSRIRHSVLYSRRFHAFRPSRCSIASFFAIASSNVSRTCRNPCRLSFSV